MESINLERYSSASRSLNCRWVIFFLPFLSVLITIITCTVSYLISVQVGKIDPFPSIPFLADFGELSIFTLGFCISAIFTLAVVIVRYHQVKCLFHEPIKTNHLSLYIGCIFVFGKLITASNELANNKIIYYSGCGVYYLFIFFYTVTQLHITRCYLPRTHGTISAVRIVNCLLIFIGISARVIFLVTTLENVYNLAQIGEWTLLINKSLFILTFMYDFWRVGIGIVVSSYSEPNRTISTYCQSTDGRRTARKSVHSSVDQFYDRVYFDERSLGGSSHNL